MQLFNKRLENLFRLYPIIQSNQIILKEPLKNLFFSSKQDQNVEQTSKHCSLFSS